MIDKNDLPALLRAAPSRSKRELLDAAADEIDSLTMALDEMMENIRALIGERRWISVEERMPEIYDTVLIAVLSRDGYGKPVYYTTIGGVSGKDGTDCQFDCYAGYIVDTEIVTHWMPLPEPPEVSE